MDILLKTEGLRKTYGSRPVLSGIDLTLRKGETMVLFGPNGAGKTTLMKILSGIMQPTEGKVSFLGEPTSGSALRNKIFYLGHKNAMYNGLTVMENMAFTAQLFSVHKDGTVQALLKEHGLWDRRNDVLRELSQGMKRRLAIMRAFLCSAPLLVLDEPFAGLDIRWRRDIALKMLELAKRGKSLLFSTHLVQEGCEIADKVCFLDKGKMMLHKHREESTPEEVQALFGPAAELAH